MLVAPSLAAPEADADDSVGNLLIDRGLLLGDGAQNFVDNVRETASDLVISAINFLGVPYRRGGQSPAEGFDCSGFTRHIFQHSVGLMLPRRADEQAKDPGLFSVARDELRPGDLVFFNTLRRTFSHVGIYMGEGKFIHSPHSGSQVRVDDLGNSYWAKRFTGARRAPLLSTELLRNLPATATSP